MSRIILRAVEPEDVDLMFSCDNDEEARIWTDYTAPISRRQLLEYALTYEADPFKAGQLRMVIDSVDKEGVTTPVGLADLYDISRRDGRAFVGIYIRPEFRRKGKALESLRALTCYCSSCLGLKMLDAKVSTRNIPAILLFDKAGYRRLCILPSWHLLGPESHDIALLHLDL